MNFSSSLGSQTLEDILDEIQRIEESSINNIPYTSFVAMRGYLASLKRQALLMQMGIVT